MLEEKASKRGLRLSVSRLLAKIGHCRVRGPNEGQSIGKTLLQPFGHLYTICSQAAARMMLF